MLVRLMRLFSATLLLAAAAADECGDIYCSSDETCCKDYPGAISETECCVTMVTDCIAPRGPFTTSTCCPRWTVACTAGSVGCCDPARPWQIETATVKEKRRRSHLRKAELADEAAHAATGAAPAATGAAVTTTTNATGFALFPATGMLASGMQLLRFDAATGVVLAKLSVSGPFAQYYNGFYGESTRVLPFDPESSQFLLAEAWDPDAGVYTPNAPLVVFAINASSGVSSVVRVQGCEKALAVGGYPVGMAWDTELRALVVGLQSPTTAAFCAITPSTGTGVDMGTIGRGTSEATSDAFYAAYLSYVSAGVASYARAPRAPGLPPLRASLCTNRMHSRRVPCIHPTLASFPLSALLASVHSAAPWPRIRWQPCRSSPRFHGQPARAHHHGARPHRSAQLDVRSGGFRRHPRLASHRQGSPSRWLSLLGSSPRHRKRGV